MDTRWWVLATCCFIVFFPAFFDQETSILVQRLTGTAQECINGTDSCLNFNLYQFNMIISVDFWTRAIAAVFAGIIIDQHGTKHALWVCAALVIVSTFIFTLGAYAKTTTGAYAFMVTGRLLFGLGTGAYAVIIHRVKTGWFLHKELALAFSVEILFDRLGAAAVFLLFGGIVGQVGLRGCLWLGFAFSLIAAGGLALLAHLDSQRIFGIEWTSPSNVRPRTLWFSLQYLDALFWLIILLVFLFEGTVQAFVTDGPYLYATTYKFGEASSSYITGIVYDLGILAPVVGWITDRYGRRDYSLLLAVALTFLGFLLVLIIKTSFPAVVLALLIGTSYTIFAPVAWTSIPLVVANENVGLGLGIGKFAANLGCGLATAAAGAILNMNGSTSVVPWGAYLSFLVALAGICVLISPLIVFLNSRTGHRLTHSRKAENQCVDPVETTPLHADFHTSES